jgi:hypothetical protein
MKGYFLATITDLTSGQGLTVVASPQDRDSVHIRWEDSDKLLRDLQQVEKFKGCLRWCDLNPGHFKFLLARNIDKTIDLLGEFGTASMSEAELYGHDTMKSLRFILMSYVYCLENQTDGEVEMIKINRLRPMSITVQMQMYIDSNYRSMVSKTLRKEPRFKIITGKETDEPQS